MYYCYDPFGSTTKITDQKAVDGSDNGNCDQNASSPQTTRYWYDPFERVTKTQAPSPETPESYSYDGLDRRETKCSADTAENCPGGQRTDYSYVGLSSKLSSQKPDGTAATDKTMSWDYSSSMEPMGMSAKDSGGTMKYRTYAKDANGSVTGLEDQNGNIAGNDRYHYDPYGDLQSTDANRPADPAATENSLSPEAKGNPMRFEGFYYDSGVKTYDMQARRYRPDTGRFLSQDRYQAAQGDVNLQADPLTQNRYAFAGGNPTNNIEFDGHGWWADWVNKYNKTHNADGSEKHGSGSPDRRKTSSTSGYKLVGYSMPLTLAQPPTFLQRAAQKQGQEIADGISGLFAPVKSPGDFLKREAGAACGLSLPGVQEPACGGARDILGGDREFQRGQAGIQAAAALGALAIPVGGAIRSAGGIVARGLGGTARRAFGRAGDALGAGGAPSVEETLRPGGNLIGDAGSSSAIRTVKGARQTPSSCLSS